MRKTIFEIFFLVTIVALPATQSLAGDRQQTGTDSSLMSGGEQGLTGGDEAMGIPVHDRQGHDLGRVVAVATRDDQILYYLVAKNGSQNELTPIPLNAARFDHDTNTVILLEMGDSELLQAPSISLDELRLLEDPEFERQVHSYYAQERPREKESAGGLHSEEGVRTQEQLLGQ